MLYYLYVAGFSLARILPIKVCYGIAEVTARLFYLFAKEDRRALKSNLKVILGKDCDPAILDRHVMEVFRNFAKYLADFFKFPRFTEEYILDNMEIEGRELLDGCISQKTGAILVSLHLGNWELGAAVLGALKYPICALVLEHANRSVNDFFIRQRSINDVKSVPVGIQIKECFRALKRNEFLAIVGDKDYTSGGIHVDFFGEKALMPKGPAAFAIKTGAPVFFVVLTREKDDKFKMQIEGPVEYTPVGDYEKDVKLLMAEYIKIFEKYIRKYPDQWYAFKELWKQERTTQ